MHTPNRTLITLAALLLGVAQLTGCAGRDNRYSGGHFVEDADDGFDIVGNRPPTPKTLCLMARILSQQGREPQAEMVLHRIIAEHPQFLPVYCDLAELQVRQGRVNEAIQTLSAGLEVAPNDAVLLNNVGMCLMVTNRTQEALDHFVAAAEARPDNARYRANVAMSLGMLGRYEQSLQTYETVVSRPAEAHYNLAVLCEARGDYQMAADEYALAGTLDKSMKVQEDIERVMSMIDPQDENIPAIQDISQGG